jgi:predicted RNase H-related nuclease YkuK (DUF458 family)
MDTVKRFIQTQGPQSKFYIGCDSEVHKTKLGWAATYVSVLVVHKDGKHGCKLFGKIEVEPVYGVGKNKQSLRLMTEVYKASELYLELAEEIGERYVEIHLDINGDEAHDSHVILSQATGYIKGVCGIEPMIKPNAFAASYAADRLVRVKQGVNYRQCAINI